MTKEEKATLKKLWNQLDEIATEIEKIRDPLAEKLEEVSESWLESDAGQEAEGEVEALSGIIDQLESVAGDVENLV